MKKYEVLSGLAFIIGFSLMVYASVSWDEPIRIKSTTGCCEIAVNEKDSIVVWVDHIYGDQIDVTRYNSEETKEEAINYYMETCYKIH